MPRKVISTSSNPHVVIIRFLCGLAVAGTVTGLMLMDLAARTRSFAAAFSRPAFFSSASVPEFNPGVPSSVRVSN